MTMHQRLDDDALDWAPRINRRLCLATNTRPGDIFPPTCKRSHNHAPPHRAANGPEWSDQ